MTQYTVEFEYQDQHGNMRNKKVSLDAEDEDTAEDMAFALLSGFFCGIKPEIIKTVRITEGM